MGGVFSTRKNTHVLLLNNMTTIATIAASMNLSLNSLREITGCQLEMNEETVRIILDLKKDVWNQKPLLLLFQHYFDISLEMWRFSKAFEEYMAGDGNKEGEENTLQHFVEKFQQIHEKHASMYQRVNVHKKKIDSKLRCVRSLRVASRIIFVGAIAVLLIGTVAAAAMAAPPVTAVLTASASLPLGSIGKWCDSLWKKKKTALNDQEKVVGTMLAANFTTIIDLNRIWVHLEPMLSMQADDFASATARGDSIFWKDLKNLTDASIQHVTKARTEVLQKIVEYPR